MEALLTQVTTILREVLCEPAIHITADTRFEDITGWDPLQLIAVVVEVECHCNVQLEVHEISGLITVGDLLRSVVAKQALATV